MTYVFLQVIYDPEVRLMTSNGLVVIDPGNNGSYFSTYRGYDQGRLVEEYRQAPSWMGWVEL